jgi:hypothetical protein
MVMDEKEVEDVEDVELDGCLACLDGSMVDETLQVLTKQD